MCTYQSAELKDQEGKIHVSLLSTHPASRCEDRVPVPDSEPVELVHLEQKPKRLDLTGSEHQHWLDRL
jgi:hypothetical protein